MLSTLKYFRHEYEEHILEKKCSACQCEALVKAPCSHTCPAGVDTPSYVALVAAGQFEDAMAVHMERNPFPSICGRVCNHPCEAMCKRAEIDDPVSVTAVKRFMGDTVQTSRCLRRCRASQRSGSRSSAPGPAGLSCAYQLALSGFPVTVFEALPVAGGMLQVGLPAFRMPKDVVAREVQAIVDLGVEIRTSQRLGRDFTVESLLEDGYDAVFLAIGAHQTEDARRRGRGRPRRAARASSSCATSTWAASLPVGRKVAVVGGGSVAMDAARSLLRLQEMAGLERDVTLVYRRSAGRDAGLRMGGPRGRRGGTEVRVPRRPRACASSTQAGRVSGLECVRMELGEPDESGRRRPVPVAGSEFVVECDTSIPAIGLSVDLSWHDGDGVELARWGTIVADPLGSADRQPARSSPAATPCAGRRRWSRRSATASGPLSPSSAS